MKETNTENLPSCAHDDLIWMNIFNYCTHQQLCKWTQVCSNIKNRIEKNIPHFFIDPEQSTEKNLYQFCSLGVLKYVQGMMKFVNPSDAAMRVAISKGHIHIVKYLLLQNQKINKTKKTIIYPSENGHLEMIQFLETKCVFTPQDYINGFKHACLNGHVDTAKYFFSKGIISEISSDLVYKVYLDGHLEMLQYLVSLGTSMHQIEREGFELHLNYTENLKMISYTIQQGVPIKHASKILYLAVKHGNLELIHLLKSKGVNINQEKHWMIPMAQKLNHLSLVYYLHRLNKN